MKKIFFNIITIVLLSCFFSSCSKCVDCASCPEDVDLAETEICEDDFDSKDEYNTAIALIEGFGCECQ